jgi:hypothetical protein
VDVEEPGVGVARVVKRMDDVRRNRHEAAYWHGHVLAGRADPERQLALEDIEAIGVLAMDVRIGPVLAGPVA